MQSPMDQLTLTLHKTKDTKNKVTAKLPRKHQGRARRGESARDAERRGRVDVALLSVLRDGLLRRSEAAELRWGDVELQEDGVALLHIRRSKTDPGGGGRRSCTLARRPPRPCRPSCPRMRASWDPAAPVFGLSASQIGRRIDAAAKAAGLGEGFTGRSGRVGMAQDLAASGVELPELMTAGRWKSSRMPARYTERQTAGRGAVARYYQGRRG